jgi:hypothetical protein
MSNTSTYIYQHLNDSTKVPTAYSFGLNKSLIKYNIIFFISMYINT